MVLAVNQNSHPEIIQTSLQPWTSKGSSCLTEKIYTLKRNEKIFSVSEELSPNSDGARPLRFRIGRIPEPAFQRDPEVLSKHQKQAFFSFDHAPQRGYNHE